MGIDRCCDSSAVCVFARALLAREAGCTLAERHWVGERELLECVSPVARTNCGTLAEVMHERARFVLRLPRAGGPLMHAQALQLQCGGLNGMAAVLEDSTADVHGLVGRAQARHGSLVALPWQDIVASLRQWTPRRRRPRP